MGLLYFFDTFGTITEVIQETVAETSKNNTGQFKADEFLTTVN